MARPKSPWHVPRDPMRLEYAFFISHAGEDFEDVCALKKEITALSGRGGQTELSCYLDAYNWAVGNDPGGVIRDCLLKSEYLVAWVTPAYLEASRRGWIWYEFAYAELIELSLNLNVFGTVNHYILPVFRGVSVQEIERSPLANFWLRKLFSPDQIRTIPEISQALVDFYHQEARKRPPAFPKSKA